MKQTTWGPHSTVRNAEPLINRRRDSRMRCRLPITVSYVDGHRFAMDHGRITNLSEQGIGMHGAQPLTTGTEVAIFIGLPNSDDALCIPEARVSWANGRRFGVALRTLKPEDQSQLRLLLAKRHRSE